MINLSTGAGFAYDVTWVSSEPERALQSLQSPLGPDQFLPWESHTKRESATPRDGNGRVATFKTMVMIGDVCDM